MNNPNFPRDPVENLADSASNAMEATKRTAQDLAADTRDSVNRAANGLRADVAPFVRQATEQVSDLAHRGADAVRHTAHQVRESADAATARTRDYIKDEPVKSVLIAAATGAALMALISMMSHSRSRY